MKTFFSTKNMFTVVFLWLTIALLIILLFLKTKEKEPLIYLIDGILILVIGLLLWILLDTKYVIIENQLRYYSGPFRGKIAIDKIRKITVHSGWYVPVNMKSALDTKGLIIFYNQFDDLYISPKHQKEFLTLLKKHNPAIEIS